MFNFSWSSEFSSKICTLIRLAQHNMRLSKIKFIPDFPEFSQKMSISKHKWMNSLEFVYPMLLSFMSGFQLMHLYCQIILISKSCAELNYDYVDSAEKFF